MKTNSHYAHIWLVDWVYVSERVGGGEPCMVYIKHVYTHMHENT